MITGHDFIQLSSRWSVLPNNEAVWRTAVSRAYYGTFHIVRTFLIGMSIQMPTGDNRNEHRFIYEALINSGNDDIRLAGSKLGDLRESRNWADYHIDTVDQGNKIAIECHLDAVEICKLITQCPSTSHAAIRSAITKWRRVAQR